jgi:hypothetical protein
MIEVYELLSFSLCPDRISQTDTESEILCAFFVFHGNKNNAHLASE